jgi:hypothetical protein
MWRSARARARRGRGSSRRYRPRVSYRRSRPERPRGQEDVEDIDGHNNLILLCANCHAVVDAQPEAFPPDELHRIKRTHEERVAKQGTVSIPNVSLRGRGQPLSLRLVQSGDALLSLLGQAFSWSYRTPDCLSPSQREVLGDLLQTCQDTSEAYEELGPRFHLEAGQRLQDGLDTLREHELVVYAATRRLTLTGGRSADAPWPETVVEILHERDARADSTDAKQSPDTKSASSDV